MAELNETFDLDFNAVDEHSNRIWHEDAKLAYLYGRADKLCETVEKETRDVRLEVKREITCPF